MRKWVTVSVPHQAPNHLYTFDKIPPAFIRTQASEPRRLLETGVYLRPGVYQNTGLMPPACIRMYRVLMFILLSSSTKIDSGVKLPHLVVHRMF